ncbi:hypothetical protein BH11PAT1_BH11PAT1_0190 [soil metagenome]
MYVQEREKQKFLLATYYFILNTYLTYGSSRTQTTT